VVPSWLQRRHPAKKYKLLVFATQQTQSQPSQTGYCVGMSGYVEVWEPQGVRLVTFPTEAGSGAELSVGRVETCDVSLAHDTEVSRLHAAFTELAGGWCVRDLTSRNGTFLNGERVIADRPIFDGDEVRIGRTRLVIRLTATEAAATTVGAKAPDLTKRERDVLLALFDSIGSGEVVAEPSSTREIAAALFVSEAAVKQHLANLYVKFDIFDGERRRGRLANEALRRGAVTMAELRDRQP
jgi:pSer/pThr/pTyr-binding forkhead associated (FHA) protein